LAVKDVYILLPFVGCSDKAVLLACLQVHSDIASTPAFKGYWFSKAISHLTSDTEVSEQCFGADLMYTVATSPNSQADTDRDVGADAVLAITHLLGTASHPVLLEKAAVALKAVVETPDNQKSAAAAAGAVQPLLRMLSNSSSHSCKKSQLLPSRLKNNWTALLHAGSSST
jgi:hypothetical protein